MVRLCFNCKNKIDSNKPICPNCFVVQRNHFSQTEVFDFLEIYFPTKPTGMKKITSSNIEVKQIDYKRWLILGLVSFGVYYYIYLLMTLKELDNHWYLPHGTYEYSTKIDMFNTTLILLISNFIGVPFIQYLRYKKLRNHLHMAPTHYDLPNLSQKASNIFWLYLLLNILFSGVILMLFFGLASIIAGKFFTFVSTGFEALFFTIAALIFISFIILAFFVVRLEKEWQEKFNHHIKWHNRLVKYHKLREK